MSNRKRTTLATVIAVFVVGSLAGSALIALSSQSRGGEPDLQIPTQISYQGLLTDVNTGQPLAGTVTLTFSLYEVDIGGDPVWTETQAGVSLSGGLFNVMLGSTNPITAGLLSGTRYLGVQVGGGAEMTPRYELSSVPYALLADEANNANRLDGLDSDFFASDSDLIALEARVSALESSTTVSRTSTYPSE